MPKMKTHSGAKKRLRVTGTNKVRRGKAGKAHKMTGKNKRRLRRLRKNDMIKKTDQDKMLCLLGMGG
ncbi:MAG: 50S ribosomal protein L35 [Sandaracinaceae bacterium]|nr:50S ribosomal protein L35 [Sandaracinaceae bacterium]